MAFNIFSCCRAFPQPIKIKINIVEFILGCLHYNQVFNLKKKRYSGAHSRVATLIQPNFQKE